MKIKTITVALLFALPTFMSQAAMTLTSQNITKH